MAGTSISTIRLKRGTKSALESVLVDDKKLLQGEPAYELDTNKIKIGDGVNDYADLPYLGAESGQQITFANRYEFPVIGVVNHLYIAKDENNSYIWNGSNYVIISVDSREIDGGTASSFSS